MAKCITELDSAEKELSAAEAFVRVDQCSDRVLYVARNKVRLLRAFAALREAMPLGTESLSREYVESLSREYAEARAQAIKDGLGYLVARIEEV